MNRPIGWTIVRVSCVIGSTRHLSLLLIILASTMHKHLPELTTFLTYKLVFVLCCTMHAQCTDNVKHLPAVFITVYSSSQRPSL